MQIKDVPIEKINIGPRFRQAEGDLESLAGSIRDMGLLQPIGIDEYYQLIFGVRRLRACRDILEWQKIPCAVLKINSMLAGEYAENEFRKQFTPSERAAIGKAIEAELGNRQGQRTDMEKLWTADQRRKKLKEKFPEVESGKQTRDIAAAKAGFNNPRTYEQAKKVTDRGTPELIAAMDAGNVSVSAAAAIASQPKADQNRIIQMPKDERREVVARIRKSKAEREQDENRARDVAIYSELYDSVQFLSRFYEEPEQAWAGITRVNGFDFAELLHRAIQCLVRLEKGNPNERQVQLIKKAR